MKRFQPVIFFVLCCSVMLVLVSALMAEDVVTKQTDHDLGEDIVIGGRSDRLRNPDCMKCHSLVSQPEGREKSAHADVRMKHGELNDSCFNCHDNKEVNKIVIGNRKEAVPFEKSYLLCSQCHGNILKDWKTGIHGSQTGNWNGEKVRKTCAACHDPHDPEFKPMKPLPAPIKPKGH